MKQHIVVREYAQLTTAAVEHPNLDQAQISETAFDWLCELAEGFRSSGANLLQLNNRRWLKLDSHVGVLESPCGQVIEILPKHHDGEDGAGARHLLRKFIAAALNLSRRETAEAGLQLYQAPLSEWVIRQFLLALDRLVKRGLRFDYVRLEEEQHFLRGQMDVVKQLRQPPNKQHLFQIRHDVFLPDRPENRLLKSALDKLVKCTQDAANWRLAHELAGMLQELPASRQIQQDFRLWRNDRLMSHYQPIKPWCELILRQHMPLAVHGDWHGISFLFPMEKLFENYVAQWLQSKLAAGVTLQTQTRSKYLCTHCDNGLFQLRPDLLLDSGAQRWVMDTKWKLLESTKLEDKKYGLSQSDFYQLFAYGQYYQAGRGDMLLIYPAWDGFNQALPAFHFNQDLHLWAVPFDMDKDHLLLPAQLQDTEFPILVC